MNDDNYQSKHIQGMFNVSPETVRNWASEFERHLSPLANPQKGKTRRFTDDDLKVFATIAKMKNDGDLFDDIHTTLDTGQRVEPPPVPDELLDLVNSSAGMKLINLLQELTERVTTLESVGDKQLRTEINQLRSERDELLKQIGRLEARLEIEQEKNTDTD